MLAKPARYSKPADSDPGYPGYTPDCEEPENITGLQGLPELIELGLFPLRIDADGAPVRAVAFNVLTEAPR